MALEWEMDWKEKKSYFLGNLLLEYLIVEVLVDEFHTSFCVIY